MLPTYNAIEYTLLFQREKIGEVSDKILDNIMSKTK